jgi:hypothetical protein
VLDAGRGVQLLDNPCYLLLEQPPHW